MLARLAVSMTERKTIMFQVGSRRQGKTLLIQEMTMAVIERGEKLYLSTSPPIADDDTNGELKP